MISSEWLAGFFDGEGYMGVSHHRNFNWYQLVMAIMNTDKFILENIRQVYGGTIQTIGRPQNPKWKICYCIKWYGLEAQAMARTLLPYSRLKSSQLKLSLEFPVGKTAVKVSDDTRIKRKELYEILKLMNKRGVTQEGNQE